MNRPKTAIVIGAGPAGLAAAYELLTRPDIRPVVIEANKRLMLVRERKSRIYFLRKFFDYPMSLRSDTIRKLGLIYRRNWP
jgi:monoamine oxidase